MNISIVTTGGTIEKTYNEYEGRLGNVRSVMDQILSSLRLPDLFIRHVPIMMKDSLEMTDKDREGIADAVHEASDISDAIIVLHGTDTLTKTGDYLYNRLKDLTIPVILTGAMRPYEFRDSDALQNVTESLLAARIMAPGVYVVMHNKVLEFPGIIKDRRNLTFQASEKLKHRE